MCEVNGQSLWSFLLFLPFFVAFQSPVLAVALGLVVGLGDAVALALPSLLVFFGLPGTHHRDFMSQCLNWLDPGIVCMG